MRELTDDEKVIISFGSLIADIEDEIMKSNPKLKEGKVGKNIDIFRLILRGWVTERGVFKDLRKEYGKSIEEHANKLIKKALRSMIDDD